MIGKIVVTSAAILMTAWPLASVAQEKASTVGAAPSAPNASALIDARVNLIKAALQLTPEQEKLWPAVEDAMRARSKNRQARLERVAELGDGGLMEALADRSPVQLMQRRAELLGQRAADLKRIADAWEPLYTTLSQDQKRRMGFVTVIVARGIRDTVERQIEPEDDIY